MNDLPETADIRYLRSMLFTLIALTITVGGIATFTATTAGYNNDASPFVATSRIH